MSELYFPISQTVETVQQQGLNWECTHAKKIMNSLIGIK